MTVQGYHAANSQTAWSSPKTEGLLLCSQENGACKYIQ